MTDLSELTVDQRLSLTTAARHLAQGVRRRLRRGDDRAVPGHQLRPVRRPGQVQPLPPAHGRTVRPTTPEGLGQDRRQGHRRSPRCCSSASQRGAKPDGHGMVRTPGRRPSRGLVRWLRTRPRGQPRRRRGHGRSRHRHHRTSSPNPGPRRSSGPPTSSSPWAAGTPAPSSPANATKTGGSTTPPASTSPPSDPSATRSNVASEPSSTRSESRSDRARPPVDRPDRHRPGRRRLARP